MKLARHEARRFMLEKQGLLTSRHNGKRGVLEVVRKAGCLQFDPIDVCGRNADLVLFARVQGYSKDLLHRLLYETRELMDQWDKNMAIHLSEDFPYLQDVRQANSVEYDKALMQHPAVDITKKLLSEQDGLTAKDLPFDETVDFYTWRHRHLSQAVLDYLFFKGEAMIYHRLGVKRSYALAQHHLPNHVLNAPYPHASFEAYQAWHLKRRIGALGLLWNKRSDAFLGIVDFKQDARQKAFKQLIDQHEIIEVTVEDIKEPLYMVKEDLALLESVLQDPQGVTPRVEFIAPLDHFLWDRSLIKQLFDFDYIWEIYIPPKKRQFDRYVLPVLYQDRLVGRISVAANRKTKTLTLERRWLESEVDALFEKLFIQRLDDLAIFNACSHVIINA